MDFQPRIFEVIQFQTAFYAGAKGCAPWSPRAPPPRPRIILRPPRRAAAPPARPSARHRAARHSPPGAGRAPQEGGGEETARGGAAQGKLGGTGFQSSEVSPAHETPLRRTHVAHEATCDGVS